MQRGAAFGGLGRPARSAVCELYSNIRSTSIACWLRSSTSSGSGPPGTGDPTECRVVMEKLKAILDRPHDEVLKDLHHRRRQQRDRHPVVRGLVVVGASLLALGGVVMLVLPGPKLPAVAIGFYLLALSSTGPSDSSSGQHERQRRPNASTNTPDPSRSTAHWFWPSSRSLASRSPLEHCSALPAERVAASANSTNPGVRHLWDLGVQRRVEGPRPRAAPRALIAEGRRGPVERTGGLRTIARRRAEAVAHQARRRGGPQTREVTMPTPLDRSP